MDSDMLRDIQVAQARVGAAELALAETIHDRDRLIRAALDAGASRYAIAKASGLSQAAVRKADHRTASEPGCVT